MASKQGYEKWLAKVTVASQIIKKYMRRGWRYMNGSDTGLLMELKEVKADDKREGVYGYSMRGSNIITLSPKALGNNDMLWATSALHEAMHANRNADERGALGKEFEFLGRQYSRGLDIGNAGLMKNAVRLGIIAERQWENDVSSKDGEEHAADLEKLGFSREAARTILSEGRRM
jgi:hypothetical protein